MLYEGRVAGSFPPDPDLVHEIGLRMTGGAATTSDAAPAPVAPGGPAGDLSLEPRVAVPRWLSPAATIAAVVVALVAGGVVLAIAGGDPIRSYVHIVVAAFGSVGVLSDTLVKATPLILTGLACSIAFRMRLWNIGAEGQFLMGAWGASAVVLFRSCRAARRAWC